jgi:UDPglucose 6-dehydrogenase
MKTTIVGAGYVGLVTGAGLAERPNHTIHLDLDGGKIGVLERGEILIHEQGLLAMIRRNRDPRQLHFTTDICAAVDHGTSQFIGLGTPTDDANSADLMHAFEAARNIDCNLTEDEFTIDKMGRRVCTRYGRRCQ